MTFRLSEREVLVLYSPTSAVAPLELSRRLHLLQADEQARAMRFVFDKDRINFATGRFMVRTVLAGYTGRDVFGLPFTFNRHGKPDLPGIAGMPPIAFNISHANGMVVAAFTLGRNVGVDVERVDRQTGFDQIARSYFSNKEVAVFQSMGRRPETFFSFWTLKEAYLKARGMGLSIPLADFSFELDPPRISFTSNIEDSPERWQFWQALLNPGYCAAVAVEADPDQRIDVRMEEIDLVKTG